MSKETLGIINETLDTGYKKLYAVGALDLVKAASAMGSTRFVVTIDALTRLTMKYPTIHLPTLEEVAEQQRTELIKSRRRSQIGLAGALIRQGKINYSLLDKNGVISISPQHREEIDPRLLHLEGLQLSKKAVSRLLASQQSNPEELAVEPPASPAQKPASTTSNPISHPEWFPISGGSKVPPSIYSPTRVNSGRLPIVDQPNDSLTPTEQRKRRSWLQVSLIGVKKRLQDVASMLRPSPDKYTSWEPPRKRVWAR